MASHTVRLNTCNTVRIRDNFYVDLARFKWLGYVQFNIKLAFKACFKGLG